MKRMLRNPFAVLLLCAAIGALTGCCTDPVITRFPIPQNAFGYIPYTPSSTFTMRHNAGALVQFSVIDTTYADSGDPECTECCDRSYGQVYYMELRGDGLPLELHLALFSTVDGDVAGPTYMNVGVGSMGGGGIEVDSDPCPTQAFTCHDSLQINGAAYFHVYELHTSSIDTTGTTVKNVWYNAAHGFLKWSHYNGEYWELMP